jgi:hypothetical protein
MWSTNGTLETSTKINIKQGQIGIPCTTEMIIVYSISKCAVSCILMSFDQYVVLSMDGSPSHNEMEHELPEHLISEE